MFVIVKILYESWGERKGKENDRESTTSVICLCRQITYKYVVKAIE
jgi:hypothetical protein